MKIPGLTQKVGPLLGSFLEVLRFHRLMNLAIDCFVYFISLTSLCNFGVPFSQCLHIPLSCSYLEFIGATLHQFALHLNSQSSSGSSRFVPPLSYWRYLLSIYFGLDFPQHCWILRRRSQAINGRFSKPTIEVFWFNILSRCFESAWQNFGTIHTALHFELSGIGSSKFLGCKVVIIAKTRLLPSCCWNS